MTIDNPDSQELMIALARFAKGIEQQVENAMLYGDTATTTRSTSKPATLTLEGLKRAKELLEQAVPPIHKCMFVHSKSVKSALRMLKRAGYTVRRWRERGEKLRGFVAVIGPGSVVIKVMVTDRAEEGKYFVLDQEQLKPKWGNE